MSRSSVNECVSVLQTAVDLEIINEVDYTYCYNEYEKISKMLLGMIRSLS